MKTFRAVQRMANHAMRHYLVGGRPVYDTDSPYYDKKNNKKHVTYNDGPMCAALFAR